MSRPRWSSGECLLLDSRFAGSNPIKNDEFLRETKIRSTTSFRGEVKPAVLCCRSYGMLKNTTSVKEILRGQNSTFIRHILPASLLDGTSNVARELWWTNHNFPVNITPPWFSVLIFHVGDGVSSSET
jgi:hypothetical protein